VLQDGAVQGTPFLDYIPKELLKPGTEGKNETDLRLEFTNGSIIQLVGTDNIAPFQKLGAIFPYFNGVTMLAQIASALLFFALAVIVAMQGRKKIA
jgi:hypothetical protein